MRWLADRHSGSSTVQRRPFAAFFTVTAGLEEGVSGAHNRVATRAARPINPVLTQPQHGQPSSNSNKSRSRLLLSAEGMTVLVTGLVMDMWPLERRTSSLWARRVLRRNQSLCRRAERSKRAMWPPLARDAYAGIRPPHHTPPPFAWIAGLNGLDVHPCNPLVSD